jgi:L-rhamnose mutarotase
MVRRAFRMSVYPGRQAEYASRHQPIWLPLSEAFHIEGSR